MKYLIMVLLVFVLMLGQAFAQDAEITMSVKAEGSAAVKNNDLGQAKDEALADAKRNAVEAGVGVFVKSEALGKDYMVVEKTILTKSEGYISWWEVIEGSQKVEKFEGNQLLTIKISAKVKLLSLIGDLSDIEVIYEQMQRPRIMVLMAETNMEKDAKGLPVSANAIMRVLQEKRFDVVDPEVIKQLVANEANRAAIERGDTKAAAILAMNQGAEILVLGTADANEQSLDDLTGGGIKSASALVNARVVYADTGDVLFSPKQGEGKGASTSKASEAGSKALDAAGTNLIKNDTQAFAAQVLARWARELQNGRTFRLTCNSVSYKEFGDIKKAVKRFRGYVKIVREKYDAKVATMDVVFKSDPDSFRERLSEVKINKKEVQIDTATGNTTSITLVK